VILLKTRHELGLMATAGKLLASVVDRLEEACVAGVTTGDLDRIADELIRKGGARPGFLGYNGFPKSICVSVNDEVVHGIPGKRRIEDGDVVSLDLGLVLEGFWADTGITVPVGRVSDEAKRLLEVTRESLYIGIAAAQPGGRLGDISAAIGEVAHSYGYRVNGEFGGHGIGRTMHEAPHVSNDGCAGSGIKLASGLTIAIEPWFCRSTDQIRYDRDGWTIRSADGSRTAHSEHTVAITDAGPQVLTRRPAPTPTSATAA